MNKSGSEELATLIKQMLEEMNKIGLEIAYGMKEIQLEIAQGMRENKLNTANGIANGIKEGDIIIEKESQSRYYFPDIFCVKKQKYDEVFLIPVTYDTESLNHKSNHHKTEFVKYKIKHELSANSGSWEKKDFLYDYEIFNENKSYRR